MSRKALALLIAFAFAAPGSAQEPVAPSPGAEPEPTEVAPVPTEVAPAPDLPRFASMPTPAPSRTQ
ncbi:MAG: hypothetical protein JRI25_12540 [Deltaproteobacteria bacterium]|nr:hypothetical protein [Deltaproteobacteria bacterium]